MAKGIAGKGILQSQGGDNGSGAHLLHLLPPIGVHPQQAPDALSLAAGGIKHLGTDLHRARIDSKIDQPADKGLGDHLESQRRKRGIVFRRAGNLAPHPGIDSPHRGHILRRRQVVDNSIE
ncbi:hypothetical protein ES708_09047 [subsurface metagenome]